MAYTRIPAQHVVYSLVEEERGKDAGRMQTVFLRVRSRSSKGHTSVYTILQQRRSVVMSILVGSQPSPVRVQTHA